MADGRTHALATHTLAVILFAAEATRGRLLGESLFPTLLNGAVLAGGAMLGLALTPDLDVNAGSISEDEIHSLSPLGENLWWIYWYPYRMLLPHRSPLSHWPIIGTAGRLLYISFPFWIGLAAAYFLDPPGFSWLAEAGRSLAALPYSRVAVLGLAAADMLHFLMDRRVFHRIFRQSAVMRLRGY